MFDPMILVTVNIQGNCFLASIGPFILVCKIDQFSNFKVFHVQIDPQASISLADSMAIFFAAKKKPRIVSLRIKPHSAFEVGNFFKKLSQGVVALIACKTQQVFWRLEEHSAAEWKLSQRTITGVKTDKGRNNDCLPLRKGMRLEGKNCLLAFF